MQKEKTDLDHGDRPQNTEEIKKQRFNQLALSNRLTEQQQQIMWFAKDNMSNKEIGDMLCIAPGTVNCHIQNIKKKCNVKKKQQLINLFREYILLE